MKTDYHLEFLRNKIEQTGTALCNLYLPGFTSTSYIIQTHSVDTEGNIRFSLIDSIPNTSRADLDSFPVRLFYYKKGLGYYLNVEAQASATHPASGDSEKTTDENMLTVKARILSAEYNECPRIGKNYSRNIFDSFRKKVSQVAAGIFWM